MKLYFGYIFDQGINTVRALGISEWALNEGLADKFTEYYIEESHLDIAIERGLNEKDALIWYIKEKYEELDYSSMDVEKLRNLAYSFG